MPSVPTSNPSASAMAARRVRSRSAPAETRRALVFSNAIPESRASDPIPEAVSDGRETGASSRAAPGLGRLDRTSEASNQRSSCWSRRSFPRRWRSSSTRPPPSLLRPWGVRTAVGGLARMRKPIPYTRALPLGHTRHRERPAIGNEHQESRSRAPRPLGAAATPFPTHPPTRVPPHGLLSHPPAVFDPNPRTAPSVRT